MGKTSFQWNDRCTPSDGRPQRHRNLPVIFTFSTARTCISAQSRTSTQDMESFEAFPVRVPFATNPYTNPIVK